MEDFSIAQTLISLASNKSCHNQPPHMNNTMSRVVAHLDTLACFGKNVGAKPLGSDLFVHEMRRVLSLSVLQPIVSWLPEGKIWRIHDLDAFERLVLPLLPMFSNFPRPMELFAAYATYKGFLEVSRGSNSVAYYNEVRSNNLITYIDVVT